MPFRFPLTEWFVDHADQVRADLDAYYTAKPAYTGRWFDLFASRTDPWRFEAGDALAVRCLSVLHDVHPVAELLIDRAEHFDALLADVPLGPALWEVPREAVDAGARPTACGPSSRRCTA